MPISNSWLSLRTEAALEPELAICDPHHHLWDHPESRYLLEEFSIDLTGGHNVVSSVFIECLSKYRKESPAALQPIGETEFVESLVGAGQNQGKIVAGIISHANLQLGAEAADVIAGHAAASPTRFRGIRHSCSWNASSEIRNSHSNPPAELYLDKGFREGFTCLAAQELVFDAWLYHPQLPELTALAKAFPNQTIVLDHVGGPLGIGPYRYKRKEVLEHWKKNIIDLAQCDNVLVKLGGLGMAINGFDWHKRPLPPSSSELAAAYKPYIMHCIDAFGVERCMFESNFPVDKISSSYTILWNSFKRLTENFSRDEKARLFHDNAVQTYKLS